MEKPVFWPCACKTRVESAWRNFGCLPGYPYRADAARPNRPNLGYEFSLKAAISFIGNGPRRGKAGKPARFSKIPQAVERRPEENGTRRQNGPRKLSSFFPQRLPHKRVNSDAGCTRVRYSGLCERNWRNSSRQSSKSTWLVAMPA